MHIEGVMCQSPNGYGEEGVAGANGLYSLEDDNY